MRKFYSRKDFTLTKNLEAICQSQDTSYGFRHVADLYQNGNFIRQAKACYYNRTWEAFEYESVLEKLIDNAGKIISPEEKKMALDTIKNYQEPSPFRAVTGIAMMGDLLCPDQKSKNDWKARMLKAGLEDKGLIMPEDWDTLTEDEKEKRLDGVINILNK